MKKRFLSALLSLTMLGSAFTALTVSADAADALPKWRVDFQELNTGKVSAAEVDLAKDNFASLNLLYGSNWEPESGYEIAAGELGKAADDKYLKLGSAEVNDQAANLIGIVDEKDRNVKGKIIHLTFDIAMSDLRTSRWLYIAENQSGNSQLTLFQTRGDNTIGIAGNKVTLPVDGGGVLPNKWYNFEYEIIPVYKTNTTIVKAWVDGEYIGHYATDKLPNSVFERIGLMQTNGADAFQEGDWTCIDNISIDVHDVSAAAVASRADYTIDFQELTAGAVTNDELQKAKDGWDSLVWKYNGVANCNTNMECVTGALGKAADDKSIKFTFDDTVVTTGETAFQIFPKAADKVISSADTINVSFELAADKYNEGRVFHYRGKGNSDSEMLFSTRGDGMGLAEVAYRGYPTSTGMELNRWYKFDFEIQPGNTAQKTLIKIWVDGKYIDCVESSKLASNTFDWLYLLIYSGQNMLGASTYMDNIKYQVVSADNALSVANENKQIYVTDKTAYALPYAKVESLGAWTGRGFKSIEVLKDGAAAAADDKLMDCTLKVTRLNGVSYTVPFADINDTRTTLYQNNGDVCVADQETINGLYAFLNAQTTADVVKGVAGRSEKDSSIRITTKTAEGETLGTHYAPWFNIPNNMLTQHLPETLTFGMSVLVDDPRGDGRFRYQIGNGGFGDYMYVYNDRVVIERLNNKTIPITPGEWVRLETVVDSGMVMKFYVNGEFAGEYKDSNTGYNRMRFDYYIGAKSNVESSFYVDDIYIGYGTPKQYSPAAGMLKGSQNADVVNAAAADKELLANGTATVGEVLACLLLDDMVSDVRVYTDRTMTAAVSDDAVMKTGNVVALTDGTNYLYYDVYTPGEGYERKEFNVYSNGQPAAETFAAGSVSAQVKYKTYTSAIREQIIIAQYSADNHLMGVAVSDDARIDGALDRYKASDAVLEANLAVTGEAGTKVKVMLWNTETMTPLIAAPIVLNPADT